MSAYENARNGVYTSKLSYKDDPEGYRLDSWSLELQFRKDLEIEFDVVGNPKADLLYSKAYDAGHASGFEEIYGRYADLVDLIK